MVNTNTMAIKERKKKYKSAKYPFATWVLGDKFKIKNDSYNSMLTSLRAYNKRHGEGLTIKAYEADKNSLFIVRLS